MSTSALIGREHPAAVLHGEVDRALASHGGLVLVTGEAGIGKTTLVTAAVSEAKRRGALVLGGSCWDSGHAPGYWPWVQVMRGLRRSLGEAEYAGLEAAAGGGLAALLGETGARPAEEDAPAAGRDGEDFRIYDAVTTALVTAAQARPVVVMLDDLHWADAASLRLLEFAAQHTWFERLLLIGTYRDVEVEVDTSLGNGDSTGGDGTGGGAGNGHPLRSLLLPLQTKATTVTLGGLGRAEVATLLARTAGKEPDGKLAEQVYRRTGGNPFFVEQAARLWSSGGTALAITPGVRDALRRRLALLPVPVRELLTTAAVLGREFTRPVLAACAAIPAAQVDGLLGQAVAGRLVTAHGAGRFSFAHDLFRETLYDSLEAPAVAARHAAVVLAADPGIRPPAPLSAVVPAPGAATGKGLLEPADLARHAYLAGDRLPAAQVVDVLVAAGEDAHSRFAFDESERHIRRALEVAQAAAPSEVGPLRRVTVGLEVMNYMCHGSRLRDAADVFRQVLAEARGAGDPEILARVALAVDGNSQLRGELGPLHAEVLVEAHAALVLGGDPRQAVADYRTRPAARPELTQLADDLSLHFATLARGSEDDEALVFVLWARHDAIWGLGSAAEREALTVELIEALRRKGDWSMHAIVTSLRWVAMLEQGDPAYYAQYETFLATVAEQDTPHLRHAATVDQSIIGALRGDFGTARELLRAFADISEPGNDFFGFLLSHQHWAMNSLRGTPEGEGQLRRELREAHHPHPEVLLAISALERGDLDNGLRHFATACEKSADYPRAMMPLWQRLQAQAAAASRDPERCERIRAQLRPHPDAWLVSFYGCDISGPVPLWIGVLDAAEERWDDAVAAFRVAHRRAELLRARPWSLLARARLAEALLARGADGDREAAAALRGEVDREAAELGMTAAVDRVRDAAAVPAGVAGALGVAGVAVAAGAEPAGAGRSGPAVPPAPPVPAAQEFRREGNVWQVSFAGRTVHLPDAKGLRDLRELLSRPGSDLPAVRLLAPEAGEELVAARRLGGDDLLDEEAKARYKRRLRSLDEEIERAVRRGDDERAAEYDRERQALLEQLRAAAGLAGRSRRLGDEAERARKTVTARIRDSLRKLDERHPELAEHLRAAVSTGAHCRYQPERPMAWRL